MPDTFCPLINRTTLQQHLGQNNILSTVSALTIFLFAINANIPMMLSILGLDPKPRSLSLFMSFWSMLCPSGKHWSKRSVLTSSEDVFILIVVIWVWNAGGSGTRRLLGEQTRWRINVAREIRTPLLDHLAPTLRSDPTKLGKQQRLCRLSDLNTTIKCFVNLIHIKSHQSRMTDEKSMMKEVFKTEDPYDK